MDLLQTCFLNFTVLFSLLLTIAISLAVMHAGGFAYTSSSSSNANTNTSATSPAAFGDDALWTADFATFAWISDLAAQESVRRVFYAAEIGLLALCTLMFSVGLWESIILFTAFGTALPTVLDKYEFIMENPWRLTHPYVIFTMGPAILLASVGCLASRVSAIACIGFLIVCAHDSHPTQCPDGLSAHSSKPMPCNIARRR